MTTKDIYGKSKGGMGTDTCHGVGIRQLNVKSKKIFLSYGHDSNEPLIEKIKEYLSKEIISHEY